jgi:general secretion pathway protein M
MSLRDRINQLEDRERRLLGVFVVVFAAFMLLVIPVALAAYLGSLAGENETMREALSSLQDSRAILDKRAMERSQQDQRYQKQAPPLAGFLAGIAERHDIEIPETQDQADVPHGKRFNERSTKITLRDVGMLKLAKLMAGIAQSGYPVGISRMNIRKRGTQADSFNVQMVVSAYDRSEAVAEAPAATSEGETTDAEQEEEAE